MIDHLRDIESDGWQNDPFSLLYFYIFFQKASFCHARPMPSKLHLSSLKMVWLELGFSQWQIL